MSTVCPLKGHSPYFQETPNSGADLYTGSTMNSGRHIVGVHTEEKNQGHSSNCLGGSVQESFLEEVALSPVAQQEEGSSA